MKHESRQYWNLPYIVPPTYELPTDVSPMERIMEELIELRAAVKKKRPAKKEKSTKPHREKKKPKKKDK